MPASTPNGTGCRSVVHFVDADAIKMMHGRPRSSRYDLIAANLFSDLLEELFPAFSSSISPPIPNVIVSGFLAAQRRNRSQVMRRQEPGLPSDRICCDAAKWMAGRAPR
jgi:ribosomal protein L11 methylase PrmA